MASPLVATEMKLRKMNSADTSPAQGRFCVMPSSIASGSLPWAVTLPGFCNSSPMPPPTTVNQNMVTSGATMDSVPMIWRMLRPRDTLATYRPIIGA